LPVSLNWLRAARGPGCGGTQACMMERPARVGMATLIRGSSVLRATRMMTGTRMTSPTSKNMGRPIRAPIRAMIHGMVAGDDLDTRVLTT